MDNPIKITGLLKEYAGTENVYFQPPPSFKMHYPAVRYEISNIENVSADDCIYKQDVIYRVTVIDRNPDSIINKRVSMIPRSNFERWYHADNLHHFVYTIYF